MLWPLYFTCYNMKLLSKVLFSMFAALIPVMVYFLSRREDIVLEVSPTPAPPGADFNNDRISYYKSKIYRPRDFDSGMMECTMLMATYKRVKMLPRVMDHYCNKLSPVNRIVLVWNDPHSPIPSSVLELGERCDKELKVIPMKENNITNRFLPQNLEGIDAECE